MKAFLKISVISFFFLLLLFYITASYSLHKKFSKPVNIEVKKGETLRSVLRKLKKSKDVNNLDLWILYYYGRLSGATRVKKGMYRIEKGENLLSVLRKINLGKGILIRITIPEGFNSYQIADLLDAKGVCKKEEFLKRTFNRFVAARYNIPSDRVEGFLYPDTYEFSGGMSPEVVIDTMIKNFWKHYTTDFKKREKELGWNTYKVVTLASIIQKETYLPEEMPLVSAVFHNRLKIGMPLQADPTVIYGIFPHFDGNLRKKDLLDKSNKWNTYVYRGLPPTPICNPGIEAIKAALYPAHVNYLYFVSMGNGKHYFSSTYKQHERAVIKYQIKGR